MDAPDFVDVDFFARLWGTTVAEVEAACSEIGVSTEAGVPLVCEDSIIEALRRRSLEGRI